LVCSSVIFHYYNSQMKKLLFYFSIGFLAIFYATIGNAQQMMIGARAGVNLASEKYDNISSDESILIKPGLLAGGQFDYWFDKSWAISIQLLYDKKGAHSDWNDHYGSHADWTISYIEVPILAKLSFGNGAVRPYIFAGPSIGFLLSNIEKLHTYGSTSIPDGAGVGYPIDTTANITDSTAKIDLSIVAGLGISINLPSGPQLYLDAAYAFGLINTDNYSWDKAYGIYVYSRDIRIAAGVLFPLN
jgi:Outer membrane protein beta-barrel domain